MDRSDWDDAPLPSIQTLGEAVAVVRSLARDMGVVASRAVHERVALWALDLSNAFREIEVNRTELYLQQFMWVDGVRLDRRCVFGSAHMVGLFQRVSSFVLAVALHRVRQFDAQHPYSAARQAWSTWRQQRVGGAAAGDEAFASIYLDDGSGMSILGEGEPLCGAPDRASQPVATSVTVDPSGRVRLGVFGDKSRGQTHLAIVASTFVEAGWQIALSKLQYGFSLDLLGLGITSEGDGALFVPEVKRLSLIEDIGAQQGDSGVKASRQEVETLVGRMSHIGQVACEANPYLQPMYRMQNAKARVRDGVGGIRKVRKRMLHVAGTLPAQKAYQKSLAWCRAALESQVSVPLAPRLTFPAVTDAGCAFLFTDAAREDGTGHGEFSVVQRLGEAQPSLLYVEQRWSPETLTALQENVLSMPAGEGFGAVVAADALLSELPGVTHLVVFTDSAATESAINSGNSASPQMNVLVRWLVARWPSVQFMGVWQQGVRNDVADGISRTRLAAVLAEAEAAGLSVQRLPIPSGADSLLSEATLSPQCAHD